MRIWQGSFYGILALVAWTLFSSASAVTLLNEDFESYAQGSFLPGQGGWEALADPGLGQKVLIDEGIGLSSNVSAGFVDPGESSQHSALYSANGGFDLTTVYTLTFDAYARTDSSLSAAISPQLIGWFR